MVLCCAALASGVLLAAGRIFGWTVSGDWVSEAAIRHRVIRSWPVVPMLALAIGVEKADA